MSDLYPFVDNIPDMDREAIVRTYYRSIDDDEYGALGDVLADGFVHYRPDRTIEGRDEFVSFMRDDRPDKDTEHSLEAIYFDDEGAQVAAEGRLLRSSGAEWFGFVDTFEIDQHRIRQIRTYTAFESE